MSQIQSDKYILMCDTSMDLRLHIFKNMLLLYMFYHVTEFFSICYFSSSNLSILIHVSILIPIIVFIHLVWFIFVINFSPNVNPWAICICLNLRTLFTHQNHKNPLCTPKPQNPFHMPNTENPFLGQNLKSSQNPIREPKH